MFTRTAPKYNGSAVQIAHHGSQKLERAECKEESDHPTESTDNFWRKCNKLYAPDVSDRTAPYTHVVLPARFCGIDVEPCASSEIPAVILQSRRTKKNKEIQKRNTRNTKMMTRGGRQSLVFVLVENKKKGHSRSN